MEIGYQFFRVLLVGNFVLGLVFIYYLLQNRERRAVTSLIVLFVGLLVWLLADIIQLWTPTNPAPAVGTALRLPGADITIIGLLLFALEYTGRENVLRGRVLALLAIKPIVSCVVALAPALDGLVVFATPDTVTQGYQFVPTPFFMFHITYNWVLTGLAIALLVQMTLQLEYGKYRQLSV
ncbi:MAG: histidine kinase N-terminal 7TM domain-containing protein, partial [Halohasta sp.]